MVPSQDLVPSRSHVAPEVEQVRYNPFHNFVIRDNIYLLTKFQGNS